MNDTLFGAGYYSIINFLSGLILVGCALLRNLIEFLIISLYLVSVLLAGVDVVKPFICFYLACPFLSHIFHVI